ncbi:MAG: hypothetical protein JST35_08745 [Armatimonadetes bacterium]|nr:hypothetical protein [Armatimonadota bacterium]
MGRTGLQVVEMVPDGEALRELLHDYWSQAPGLVTATADASLSALRAFAPEEGLITPLVTLARQALQHAGRLPYAVGGPAFLNSAVAALVDRDLFNVPEFRAAGAYVGFHQEMLKVLHELHHLGFDADRLEAVSERLESPTREWVSELGKLDRELGNVLHSMRLTQAHRLLRACFDLEPDEVELPDRLFVLTHSEISPLQIDWIKWASRYVKITTVAYRHPAEGTFRAFERLADPTLTFEPPQNLAGTFFTTDVVRGDTEVEVVAYADEFAEAEWTLRRAAEFLSENSVRADEVVIFARDHEKTLPLLESVSERLGIRISSTRRVELTQHPTYRIIQRVLRWISGEQPRNTASILQVSLFNPSRRIPMEWREALELIEESDGDQWLNLEEWVADEEKPAWLAPILNWRRHYSPQTNPLHTWLGAFKDLLGLLGSARDDAWPGRDAAAVTAMIRALGPSVHIAHEVDQASFSLSDFIRFAVRSWEIGEVSFSTGDRDEIRIASNVDQILCAKKLFVMGMIEGDFPRRRHESPLLTREEIKTLVDLEGLGTWTPSYSELSAKEREILLFLLGSSRSITMSYPRVHQDSNSIPSSFLIDVIDSLEIVPTSISRSLIAPELEDCTNAADRRLREALDGAKKDPLPNEWQVEHPPIEEPIEIWPEEAMAALQCNFKFQAGRLSVRPPKARAEWYDLRKLPSQVQLFGHGDLDQARGQLEAVWSQVASTVNRSAAKRVFDRWIRTEAYCQQRLPLTNVRRDVRFGSEGVAKEVFGLSLKGTIPVVGELGFYNTIILTQSSAVEEIAGSKRRDNESLRFGLKEEDVLVYGLYAFSVHQSAKGMCIQVESMGDRRTLIYVPSYEDIRFPRSNEAEAEGLKVIEVNDGLPYPDSAREFGQAVKTLAKKAKTMIETQAIATTPGEHCRTCRYGELCRRSKDFGEEEDLFEDE